eukprot:4971423-Lingulodinium_polyedra.AAC.1
MGIPNPFPALDANRTGSCKSIRHPTASQTLLLFTHLRLPRTRRRAQGCRGDKNGVTQRGNAFGTT